MRPVDDLLERQAGVISRAQALAAGHRPHDIARRLRRREWAPMCPGIYLSHTGEPSWLQRAWMGVLCSAPAALDAESALRAQVGPAWRGRNDHEPIHVAIDFTRTVRPPPGVIVRRVPTLADRALWNLAPPRLRMEEAVLAAVGDVDVDDEWSRLELLAQAIRCRVTTVDRVLETVSQHQRITNRSWLVEMLCDVRDGTHSVLEREYRTRVERAHGLPCAIRQRRWNDGRIRRYDDVVYEPFGVVVELDGALDHSSFAASDRDLRRDLARLIDGTLTIRLSWGAVVRDACATARHLGMVLRHRGWNGHTNACDAQCPSSGDNR